MLLHLLAFADDKYTDVKTCADATFANFNSLTQDNVAQLVLKMAKKSCPLDPIRTTVVDQVLDFLLPVITRMINMSFESDQFAEMWIEALLRPSLKELGLDIVYRKFRVVGNLL